MTTLNDIKSHMLRYMSAKITPSDDSYYDENGHCGDGLWNDIYTFWENFKSDKDFLYLVSCEWASDDLDLGGGRSYILTHSNIITLVFDYLYNTLGYTKENYNKIIWNSTEFSDNIQKVYDWLKDNLPGNIQVKVLPSAEFTPEALDNEQCQLLGCSADYDVYSGENTSVTSLSQTNWRFAGKNVCPKL